MEQEMKAVTPEVVFGSFMGLSPPTEQMEPEKEDSVQQRPKKDKFYNSDDSDNDSDFETKYSNPEDTFNDIAHKVAAERPIYISDAILGLRSNDLRRYQLALKSLPQIMEQTSNDLEERCPEILQTLFRAQNKFEKAEFLESKYEAVVAVINRAPLQSLKEVVHRIKDSECGMGEKLALVDSVVCSARIISNGGNSSQINDP